MSLRQIKRCAAASPTYINERANILTTFLYILLAVLAFGVMIFIHEAGHFFAARAFGVKIYEFALGMGPRIFGWRGKGGTDYNLRLFPIGGFVSMKGEDEDADGEDSFSSKKAFQRFIIVAAGAVMNILLAVVVIFFLVITTNQGSTVILDFDADATSNEWLMAGDKILAINGAAVNTATELSYEILHDGFEPVDVTVLRNGERIVLHDVVFPTSSSSGMLFGSPDFRVYAEKKSFPVVMKHTFFRSISTVKMIWESLLDLISGRVGVDAVSGPVGAAGAITEAARTGVSQFFNLVSILSMNLGVFNLLPVPALDGGRLLFIFIEMVLRRKVPQKFEAAVHFAGIVILLGLMVLITFKDIASFFGG